MIYSSIAFTRFNLGSSLGTLDGSVNPSTAGIYTYTDDLNLVLLPGTMYFIVVTAGTTVANSAYEWSLFNTLSYNPNGGWKAGGVWESGDGSNWRYTSGAPLLAVTATAIPEPSAWSLLAIGSGVFLYVRTRKHHSA
jgi:hypothetical protein